MTGERVFREWGPERAGDFLAAGHRLREFFPHRARRLPKGGPDAMKLATRMCGPCSAGDIWEVVLNARPEVVDEFPADLFFDRDLVWHGQHLGLPGHVATANAIVSGGTVTAYALMSDTVQRIGSHRREHKTRVEKLLGGWPAMMLNALLDFALDTGAARLRVCTAELQRIDGTDRTRTPAPELFERIYDRTVERLLDAQQEGRWWVADLRANARRVVRGERRADPPSEGPIVCVCHDLEGGSGHLDEDAGFAAGAERALRRRLDAMLASEARAGVSATYNVVGRLMAGVRGAIEDGGHCLAFHSYDHGANGAGLARCREVDYRLKGYRPPRSELTPDVSDGALSYWNFEWLASSAHSLGHREPAMRNGIVKIPVHLDDHRMHAAAMPWEEWKRRALGAVEQDVAVLSLHDCYGDHWLQHYDDLLAKLSERARLRTLDELAGTVALEHAA